MPDVVVVGGGPAGLTAATTLAGHGVDVAVLDREHEAGGVPRHSDHTGYGLRDLGRVLHGPRYAQVLVARARAAGVDVHCDATVTGWDDARTVQVTAPTGRNRVRAEAIVLATGCRERPRSARLVPGSRPAGVLTTGELQQQVYLYRQSVGTRAVVVGAEHVSYSAVLTLRHAGCDVVALVTDQPRPTTFRGFDVAARWALGVRTITDHHISQIMGERRVTGVRIRRMRDARTSRLSCDTVVFTGDWIADHELARRHRVDVGAVSTGVVVDAGLRTNEPGVFAVGNLVHPVETADVCALDGQHVAASVVQWLSGAPWPTTSVPLEVQAPLKWVSPSRISDPSAPALARLRVRSAAFARTGRLEVSQGSRQLWSRRVPWTVPDRPISVATPWLTEVDLRPDAPPVVLSQRI